MTFNELVEIIRHSGRKQYIDFMKKYNSAIANRGEATVAQIKEQFVNNYLREA